MLTYDTKVKGLFTASAISHKRVGIEMEFEECYDYHMHEHLCGGDWEYTDDPSLRNHGLELVSRPLPLSKVRPALERLDDWIGKVCPTVNLRTGMHVHYNVGHTDVGHIMKSAVLYTVLEPYIFHTFAPGREENHFCVPLWMNTNIQAKLFHDNTGLRAGTSMQAKHKIYDMQWADEGMIEVEQEVEGINLKCLGDSKYSALNFTSLKKLNTLEYRMCPSTLEIDEIERFVTFVVQLHNQAELLNDPFDVFDLDIPSLAQALGLRRNPRPDWVFDARVAATLMAGQPTVHHTELKWEI